MFVQFNFGFFCNHPENIFCEGEFAILRCPRNYFPHIHSADYGRKDNSKCQNGKYPVDSDEMKPTEVCTKDVKAIVRPEEVREMLLEKCLYEDAVDDMF